MEHARTNLVSVDLFRTARLELAKESPADTALPVEVVIKEDHARFTTLEAGYATDGAGVTGQVRWTHPNFTGGARSLNAILLAQTGWWATSDTKDRLLRTTLVLNQPNVGAPTLSLGFGPSFEARDGFIDRSTAWSGQATLVWRINTLQSAALRYEYTHRIVAERRILGTTNVDYSTEFPGLAALVDSLRTPINTSLFNLNTSVGTLDDFARPRHGVVLKPNVSITAPRAWGNVEFGRMDLQATAFAPLPGRSNAVMLRGNLGGLWPFGESVPPAGENPSADLVRLRDFILTAGGASDVRGYATRMLGPKIPQVQASISGTDTVLTADQYVEVGGLRRWTATIELRLAVPSLGRNTYAHLFSDAGRVWTSDSRFVLPHVPTDDLEAHFTTGGGLGYYTPVGAIRFDVGYKLNPSAYDLRHSQDVFNAIRAGLPATSAPVDHWRKWGLHLSLGLFF
jgi:outer membrane protein assembly factor BamA